MAKYESVWGVQAMTKSGVIDFIKIDIEGEEKQIFEDRASWPALCEVRCIATEIHGWIQGAEEALKTFLTVRLLPYFLLAVFLPLFEDDLMSTIKAGLCKK